MVVVFGVGLANPSGKAEEVTGWILSKDRPA